MSLCDCQFTDTSFLPGACGSTSYAFFMALVEFMLRRQCSVSDPCRRAQARIPRNDRFDFIVVGAGVAGPVVTSRLSENPEWNVLLLEAGPEEPSVTSVPAFCMSAIGSSLDWKYVTENSSQACLNNGGHCHWPRGKMVSGSSGMQGMMYTRPHHSILDEWGKQNPGWSFKEVLPYFIKSERNLNPNLVERDYHGFNGPMTVQQFPSRPPLADDVVKAGVQLGYRNGDLTGSNQTGVEVAQMMLDKGLRMSTAKAYLRPHLHSRRNLKVVVNSQVTKVLIDPKTKKATGVQYVDKNGVTHTAHALKEVILSAGAVNSPQLLLLSGVGPSEDLKEVGVDVKVNLPGVGKNLQNHVATGIGFYMQTEQDTVSLTYEALNEFLTNRTGPMASTGVTQTTLFMTSKYANNGVPDLQVFVDGFLASCARTGRADECLHTGELGNCSKRVIHARPTNVLPLSRGYIKLKSANPLDHPLIYPNYLSEQRDVNILIDGVKQCISLMQTPALKKYNFTLDTSPTKGCENLKFGTDEYFECSIRRATGAENHQAGSCKMGPETDKMAVVDSQLRVHGVGNLRVVDASIFPINPNSNPTSVIIMAAEKLSEMITKTWKEQRTRHRGGRRHRY